MSNNVVYTQITGFDELSLKIKALATDREKIREVRAILRKVAGSTVAAIRANAPVSKRAHKARGVNISPGTLQRSIGTITGRNEENPTIFVGPRAKSGLNGWYGHFVEEDTNVYSKGYKRKKRTRGANAGSSAAVSVKRGQHFIQKAFTQTGGMVSQQAESEVDRYFQKRINALSR